MAEHRWGFAHRRASGASMGERAALRCQGGAAGRAMTEKRPRDGKRTILVTCKPLYKTAHGYIKKKRRPRGQRFFVFLIGPITRPQRVLSKEGFAFGEGYS